MSGDTFARRGETFARRLELALKRSGASQARLARDAEIDQSSISRYLRGQCEPNLRQFRAIADALEVPPSFLLAELEGIVLAPSGQSDHYYAFRDGKLVGEWKGEVESVFVGGVVATQDEAHALLAKVGARSRAGKNGKARAGPDGAGEHHRTTPRRRRRR